MSTIDISYGSVCPVIKQHPFSVRVSLYVLTPAELDFEGQKYEDHRPILSKSVSAFESQSIDRNLLHEPN